MVADVPVIGGAHVDAWAQPEILKQTFDFFDKNAVKKKLSPNRSAAAFLRLPWRTVPANVLQVPRRHPVVAHGNRENGTRHLADRDI